MTFLATLLLFAAPPFTCPATNAGHDFERVNVYNGQPGKDEADLAPDDEKPAGAKISQFWFVKDYRRENVFVRCRYRGTTLVINQDVPAQYQKCTFVFEMDKKNTIVGKPSFRCE